MLEWLIIGAYGIFLLFIFLFSLGQLHLAWHYLQARKVPDASVPEPDYMPLVTVQLPVYNEKYVVERLIDRVCQLDYPADKLEIQVLDDSTDETRDLIEQRTDFWKAKGIRITHIHRKDRHGFKAGALANGFSKASGEFIAVFDADFLPENDFLKRTIPAFDRQTGVVQTRWGHLNREYSLLTKLQAFGLDAHFSVEQTGRSHAGSFINFNGTAGVWRKACIADAGGWSADTLTEDLDLSYRAQLKGWKFKYLESCVAPAELPVIMPAVKSQQYRWNKGAAETARKNLGKVFRSGLSFTGKFHALFHLLNSSVFICLFLAAVLSVPVLWFKANDPGYAPYFHAGVVFLVGFFAIAWFYWISVKSTFGRTGRMRYFFSTFPLFLVVSMGLSLHNGIAVMEGLLGIKTPFIRTPKFNILQKKDRWQENAYIYPKLTFMTILEGLLALYFLLALVAGVFWNDYGLTLFHGMLALGFGAVFYFSVRPVKNAAAK